MQGVWVSFSFSGNAHTHVLSCHAPTPHTLTTCFTYGPDGHDTRIWRQHTKRDALIHCGCLECLPRGLNKCSDLDSPADTDVRVISVLRFRWLLSSSSTSTLQRGRIRERRCAERTSPPESRDFVARCAIASCPDARAPSRRVCDAMITDFAQVFGYPAPFITQTP